MSWIPTVSTTTIAVVWSRSQTFGSAMTFSK